MTKSKLQERSKLTRIFFQKGKTMTDLIKLEPIFKECTDLILDAKNDTP